MNTDANANRNTMGSRAGGTSLKPKFGAGNPVAPARQGTVGRVYHHSFRD